MYVGIAQLSLLIGDAHSLKDKRMVVRRIKDRVRERLHVTVNEVGELDTWGRAELGCAVASADRGKALALIDEVVRVAMSAGGAQIAGIAKDVVTFDAPALPVAAIDDRTGAGDKAAGLARMRGRGGDPTGSAGGEGAASPLGDDDFVPEEWRDHE